MVRWIQLRATRYAHRQAMTPNLALKAPTFVDLLKEIMLDVQWMPTYDSAYAGYGALTVNTAGPPQLPPVQGGAPGTGASGGGGGGAAQAERGVIVTNSSLHDDFSGYRQVQKTLKEIVAAAHPVPATLHHPNIHYCLSYHLRKTYNTNCTTMWRTMIG
jgi:hypothetical protein